MVQAPRTVEITALSRGRRKVLDGRVGVLYLRTCSPAGQPASRSKRMKGNPTMAPNPRRKGRKATNETPEEETVTDTATEAAPEVEAPADAEAPAKAKADEPKPDYEANLFDAVVTFSKDNDVKALQEAYRAVPAAARGRVQGVAMKRAMTEAGVDMEVLGNVLDAFNNLPTASKPARTKVEIDPTTAGAVRLYGLMSAFNAVREEVGEDSYNLADQWLQGSAPEEHDTLVSRTTEAISKATALRTGNSGPRRSFKETLKDLVSDGRLPVGAVLKGANEAEAIVNEDGTISTNGESFENPSGAAKVHRVQKDGETKTQTNGWDFWTYDGKSIGELRTA